MIFKNKSRLLIEVLEVLIMVFALSWFSRTYLFELLQVTQKGMLPTLGPNSHVIVDKTISKRIGSLKRGEIVVYLDDNTKYYSIKRLIGLNGDEVEIRNGFTYINREPLFEPYAYIPITYELKPIIIPKGYFFVLNDNRSLEKDPKVSGIISQKNLVGEVIFCYWPAAKIKSL